MGIDRWGQPGFKGCHWLSDRALIEWNALNLYIIALFNCVFKAVLNVEKNY